MATYHPAEVKLLIGGLGYLECGRFPPDDAEMTEFGGSYESKPPAAAFAAWIDMSNAISALPEFEWRCVLSFAAILGGGKWRMNWVIWAEEHGQSLVITDAKIPSVYRLAALWMGEPKTNVVYGVERACVRIALRSGWVPKPEEEISRTYGRHIRSVRFWDGRTTAKAS